MTRLGQALVVAENERWQVRNSIARCKNGGAYGALRIWVAQVGTEINMGVGKYLGFLVGPGTSAQLNFASSMDKFRLRAASWLEMRRAGQFFQILGFNMFVTSVFIFVSQLYILPDDWMVECRALALKMMLGP